MASLAQREERYHGVNGQTAHLRPALHGGAASSRLLFRATFDGDTIEFFHTIKIYRDDRIVFEQVYMLVEIHY